MNPIQSRAEKVIPGGVNSPVRAFQNVQHPPLYAHRGEGPFLYTKDDRKLIDLCLSFGPLILGHAFPTVTNAIQEAATKGSSFAVTTEQEIELAELIVNAAPSIEKVRLMNSGTEAVMTALRLARGVTGRDKIIKFSGCYHGHVDSLLVEAGSGVAGISKASSAGVTLHAREQTLVVPYNDTEKLMEVLRVHGNEIAGIIVEPIAANMGIVFPKDNFLQTLRKQADEYGALLIFDEVITGFRLQYGLVSEEFGIQPDLTCLGKIIGGGMPIGAVGGKKEIMDLLAPVGNVYQAGTLSGNPISVAAGLATLKELKENQPYPELAASVNHFYKALQNSAREYGLCLSIQHKGSMFSLFFRKDKPTNFEEVLDSEKMPFKRLFKLLLNEGIYLPPSPFETCFLSIQHDDQILEKTIQSFNTAFSLL